MTQSPSYKIWTELNKILPGSLFPNPFLFNIFHQLPRLPGSALKVSVVVWWSLSHYLANMGRQVPGLSPPLKLAEHERKKDNVETEKIIIMWENKLHPWYINKD